MSTCSATPSRSQTFLGRSKLIAAFRKIMARAGVRRGRDARRCRPIAGGAAARPFVTHHNALDIDLFLRIAPELYLKRLLVGGMERVFEIGRVYRNEGISPRHNPEFTMMEAYQAYGDYHAMMDLTEALICGAIEALDGGYRASLGRDDASTSRPPGRGGPTPSCSASTRASIRPISPRSRPGPRRRASRRPARTRTSSSSELFEAVVEDRLNGPIFVIDYPAAICPLTKRKASNPAVAERFELFVHGMELANAYTELNDPRLAGRALPQAARRPAGGGFDGQDGRRLRPGPQARDAPGRRTGHRHRPALHGPLEPAPASAT